MIFRNVVVAVVIKTAFRILKIIDMPVPLVQGILHHFLILADYSHTDQKQRRHKKGVRPGLLREIIVRRHGMLQYTVPETQRIPAQIFCFTDRQLPVPLFPGCLVQGDQTVPHGAGIYRPHLWQAKVDQLIHPVP